MQKQVKKFYDKVGDKYALWQEQEYLNFSSMFDEISWLQFSQFLPKSHKAKILDAGCGGGGWSLRLAKMGYTNLTLLDISPANLKGAKAIFAKHKISSPTNFIEADLEKKLPFPNNHFDFIFCERDPLEYCTKKQEYAFKELVRVIKPKSLITISIGNSYVTKQKLLAEKKFKELFEFEKYGIRKSQEGLLKPASKEIMKTWFKKNNIKKLQIAGRLTITDKISEKDWEMIYKDSTLKNKLLKLELKYQKNESLAESSSHIFAAGMKL